MKNMRAKIGVLTLIAFFSGTPIIFAASKTFTETFETKKFRDPVLTTAVWDTENRVGRLPSQTSLKVWETLVSGVRFNPMSVGARDNEWFVGGSLSNGLTVLIGNRNGVFTNLTPEIPSTFSGPVTAIGVNNDYWLLGGSAQLMKFDGTTFTDVSSPNFDSLLGAQSVNDIDWNGSMWLISGTNSKVISYDGTTFRDVTGNMAFGTGSVNSSWNGAEWLIAGYNGNAYLFDGTSATPLTSPFTSVGTISTVYSDGDNWLLGGRVNNIPVLYQYDGESFHDWSSLLPPNGDVYNTGWDGQYWIISTYGANSADTIWQVRSDGSSAKVLSYKTSARGVFEIDEFAATSNGWVMIGNVVNNGTSQFVVQAPEPYAKKRQLQSKTVAKVSKSWIRTVTLTATDSQPSGTSIVYYLSTNNGQTWKKAKPGQTLTFSSYGSRLKWKAVLQTNSLYTTPSVTEIMLTYSTKRS